MIPTAISGLIYNKKDQKLLTAGTSQDGTFYYSTDYKEDDTAEDNTAAINAATWTTTVPTGKNAGKYNIYWRFAGNDGFSDIAPTLITGEIGKADITINMSSTSGTLTYPNTSISFNVSLSTDEVEYNYVDNVEDEIDRIVTITRNGNNFTLNWVPNSEGKMLEGDVGVLIIANGNENYNFTMDSFKVTTEYGTIKSTSTDGKATYNGSATNGGAKVAVTEPSTGYTIKYGKTEGTYDLDSIPTYTNAGIHTVYYKISAENYKDKTGKLNIVISKKVAVVTTAPKARDLTYNGSAQSLVTAGTTNNGTLQYSLDNKNWSTTIPTGTNAGTYDVYYKVVGDSNHSDSTPVKLTVTIATGTIDAYATNGNTTYTGNATNGGAKVTVITPTSGYTIKYGTSSTGYDSATIPTFVNAGTHTVYYQITAPNYSAYNGRFDIIINKANASVTKAPTAKTLTYSGSSQELVNAGTGTGGTFKYSTDNTNWSTTIPTKTAAGTYTVYYKVIGDSNHNDSTVGSVKVTINTKTMKVTATNGSATYTGSATNGGAKVTVTDPTSGYTVKYGTTSGTYTLDSIPTYINAGSYTVYYQVTATNYTTFTGSLTIAISTKAVSISVINGTAVYSGNATNGGAKVTVSDPSSGATVRYGTTKGPYNLTAAPTYTNAGTYTIYYQVTATNYASRTGSLIITISKADAKVTKAPTAKTLTYTGSSQALVTAGAGTGGTFKYSTDNTNWSTTIPTKTPAGTYTVYYKVTGDDNHNDSSAGSVKVTISKADAKVTTVPEANALSYTGSSQELVTAGEGTGGTFKYSTDSTNWSTSIPTKIDAGTYTVYYKVTGDSNHNDSAIGQVTVTIKETKSYILASGETVNAKLNEIIRNNSGAKLTRIAFTDEPIPDGMSPTTYDLSEKQDGSVIAFCTMNLGDETNYSIVITTQTSGQNVIFNKDSSSMFSNLSMNYIDFLSVDTSNVKTFLCMFKSCRFLYEINNLNNFDTSSAENMNSMFYSCYSLRKVDVSTFDTSNVTTFSRMFGYDSYLTELNVSGFDTGSVTNMEAMFDNCSSLTELDLSSFSTNYVTEFSAMFRNCENLKIIYASGLWYPYASIRSTNMFSGCENIVGQTGTIYDSSRTDVSMANYIDGYLTNMNMSQQLVSGSVFKQNIPSTATTISFTTDLPNPRYSLIDLSAATDYGVVGWLDSDNVFNISTRRPNKKIEFNENSSGMFMSLGLKNIDFDDNSIDTSRVTDMSYMFTNCSSLLSLDLSAFDTNNVTNMSDMFSGCSQINTIYVSALWDTSNVTSSSNMFYECTNIEGYYSIKYNSSKTDKSMANYTTGYLQEKNNSTAMHIEVLFNNSVRDKITRYVPSNLTFEKLIQAGLFGSAGKVLNGAVSTGTSISTNSCYLHKKDSAGNSTYVGSGEYPRTDVTYWYDIYAGS